jgi:glycosyltransferase involved in cell wall biosynthesis
MRVLSLNIGFLEVGGGIASAGRSLVDELAGRFRGEEHEVIAHSLLGHESAQVDLPASPWVITRGFEGNKVRFALSAVTTARRFKPDWLFVDHISLLPVAVPAARACGARLALFLHGKEIYGGGSRPGALTYRPPVRLRMLATKADQLFANSPWTARLSAEALESSSPPTLSWLPVEESKANHIARARAASESPASPYILMVSRIEPGDDYKGHQQLLAALNALPQHFSLRIVGAGKGADELRREVANRRLEARVQVLGFVSNAELAKLYVGATAFVMLSSGEGLGLVYLESLLAGVPAIGLSPGPIDDLAAYGAIGATSGGAATSVLTGYAVSRSRFEACALPTFSIRLRNGTNRCA